MIQPQLQKKIIEKRVKDIYICLDEDAIRNALSIAKKFMGEGLNVYFIELKDQVKYNKLTKFIMFPMYIFVL